MDKKERLNLLQLSKNEQKVLKVLSLEGQRTKHLVQSTGIPHASICLTLEKLSQRGLARRKRNNHKVWWFKESQENILEAIDKVQTEITGTRGDVISTGSGKILLHTGIESLKQVILKMVDLEKGSRVTIFQSANLSKNLESIFNSKELELINKTLSKENLLFESIVPNNFFQKLIPVFGQDWANSYSDRANRIFTIPEEFNFSKAEFHLYPKYLLVIDYEELVAIEVTNPEVIKLIRGLLGFVKQKAN